MIPIPTDIQNQTQVILGSLNDVNHICERVWNDETVQFLNELAVNLRRHPEASNLADLMALAFWLRKANLLSMKTPSHINYLSMGLGLTFHICPSNVPINFAYSMAFALLAGNNCVLRLSTKTSPSTDIVLHTLNILFSEPKYKKIAKRVLLIRYTYNDEITAFWLSHSAARIIWGGDNTIKKMRQFNAPPRSREIAFSDRYSFCLFDAEYVLSCEQVLLVKHCHQLFNDIYQLDQAGCSSPQMCVWLGDKDIIDCAQERLWNCLEMLAKKKYAIKEVQVVNKFVDACNAAISHEYIDDIRICSEVLTRIQISTIKLSQQNFRGSSGLIYEAKIKDINQLKPLLNDKIQTLSYLGIDNNLISQFITQCGCNGIDRVVPLGNALNMHNIWDGYDIISTLSRIVTID